MALFILRRIAIMLFTSLCLTFVVFFLTNLYPNLEKMAKTQGNFRMDDQAVLSFLENRGYLLPLPIKYGEWLGVYPGYVIEGSDGEIRGRCFKSDQIPSEAPGIVAYYRVIGVTPPALRVMCGYSHNPIRPNWNFNVLGHGLMVPSALIIGILAGMREGSRTDRSLSTFQLSRLRPRNTYLGSF